MFSVTKTGRNFLPLWTAKVTPIISGRTVDLRDHVLTGPLCAPDFERSTHFRSDASTNGPFLIERANFEISYFLLSSSLSTNDKLICSLHISSL
jgi:hypothetical protein